MNVEACAAATAASVAAHQPRGIFVTGTDTGVGKTCVAAALLRTLATRGWRAVGMKPIATGVASGTSRNADVAALLAAGNLAASVSDVNPYSFAPAIAPHLAAEKAGVVVELEAIAAAYARLAAHADVVVVEGAGGTLVPLSPSRDMLDVPARLNLPVLLVVGIRLGCLNHALLSALAINARGLTFAGWIANRIDPEMLAGDDNIAALAARLPAPLVADLSWCPREQGTLSLPESAIRALALVR
jgi:dethiobiotin synthetase